jgi:hypothetical protein
MMDFLDKLTEFSIKISKYKIKIYINYQFKGNPVDEKLVNEFKSINSICDSLEDKIVKAKLAGGKIFNFKNNYNNNYNYIEELEEEPILKIENNSSNACCNANCNIY